MRPPGAANTAGGVVVTLVRRRATKRRPEGGPHGQREAGGVHAGALGGGGRWGRRLEVRQTRGDARHLRVLRLLRARPLDAAALSVPRNPNPNPGPPTPTMSKLSWSSQFFLFGGLKLLEAKLR